MKSSNGKFSIKEGILVPIGATCMDGGVNFSVSIPAADECKLVIYEKGKDIPYDFIKMGATSKMGSVFCVFIQNFDTDRFEYVYEVMGKEMPDPSARMINGRNEWGKPLSRSLEKKVRSVVYKDTFNWENDKRPKIPYEDAIFYKVHLRGYTNHVSSKVQYRGTFKGFEEKVDYIKKLGITSVIFMPVYEFDEIIYDKYIMTPQEPDFIKYDDFIEEQKKQEDPVVGHFEKYKASQGIIPYKINYWGYGVENCYYYAPKASYASEPQNAHNELKKLVKKLHEAGIECIMEFVFADGVNSQFVTQCFRYWVMEYHIDGFKFNANAVNGEFVATDPLLTDTKLICEGWNEERIYSGGNPCDRNLGIMNDDFMINARKYLKGDEEQAADFSYKFRRNPSRTGVINYITNSNGFTLADLYSYDVKHNMGNGEYNTDGTDYNHSWNCGVEGKTRKSKVLQLRKKQMKNAFMFLLLSQGSPMILAGDEFGNSQEGNNNVYCQDNPIGWINWNNNTCSKEMFRFVTKLIELRKAHRILHMKDELRVMDYASFGCPDMSYHGTKAWYPEFLMYSRTLGIMLYGKYAGRKKDNSFYIAINMHWENHDFDLPKLPDGKKWRCLIDSGNEAIDSEKKISGLSRYNVTARTVTVFISD